MQQRQTMIMIEMLVKLLNLLLLPFKLLNLLLLFKLLNLLLLLS